MDSDLKRGRRARAATWVQSLAAFLMVAALFLWSSAFAQGETPFPLPLPGQCGQALPPDQGNNVPPGHWFNPDRIGQGWDLTHWDDETGRKLKITWYTFNDQRQPVWYETEPATFNQDSTGWYWRGQVLKRTRTQIGTQTTPIGDVSLRVQQNPKVLAIKWKRTIASQEVVIDECIFDIFRNTPIHQFGPRNATTALSGVWSEVVDPRGRAISIQKGYLANEQAVELVFPQLFDSSGEPVWLYGQYGPLAGPMPDTYTFDLKYVYLNYGANGTGQASDTCSGIDQCVIKLEPTGVPFKFTREIGPNTQPNDTIPGRLEIGAPGTSTVNVPNPGPSGSHAIESWVRPASGSGYVQLRKLNTYSTIQVNRYDCEVESGQTCAIRVDWSSGLAASGAIKRYTMPDGPLSAVLGVGPSGSHTDQLGAGSHVRYRLYTEQGVQIGETPDVRVYGRIRDAVVEDLGVPPHDPTVGAMPGTPGVSGGSATYSIPIAVPPGRRGMAPSIALTYSSRAGNGAAGMGWSIAGLSSIHRCPQTVATDGNSRSVTYTNEDRLCLDGQRLIPMNGGTYGQSGTQYRTEIDSFDRVTQLGSNLEQTSNYTYFRVDYKSGEMAWFGAQSISTSLDNGRHYASGQARPLSWAVVRRLDRNGNAIRFVYANLGQGEYPISEIRYTGRELSGQQVDGNRKLQFFHEPRPHTTGHQNDLGASYLAGGLSLQRHRLSRIEVHGPVVQTDTVGSQKLRQYALTYGSVSASSGRSVLRSVQECAYTAGVASCRLPTQFAWQESGPAFGFREIDLGAIGLETVEITPGDISNGYQGVNRRLAAARPFGDIDGDGSRELLISVAEQGPGLPGAGSQWSALLTTDADGEFSDPVVVNTIPQFSPYLGTHPSSQPSDVDNDGAVDLVGFNPSNMLSFAFWNGGNSTAWSAASFQTVATAIPYATSGGSSESAIDYATDIYVRDFTGDGKADVLLTRGTGTQAGCVGKPLWLYRGTTPATTPRALSFAAPSLVSCLVWNTTREDGVQQITDFDGNGLPDVLVQNGRAISYATSDPPSLVQYPGLSRVLLNQSTSAVASWTEAPVDGTLSPGWSSQDMANPAYISRWMDVNGDGLLDLVTGRSDGWYIHINSGGRFLAPVRAQEPLGAYVGLGPERCDPVPGGAGAPAGICARRYADTTSVIDRDGDGRDELTIPFGFAVRMCMWRPSNPNPFCASPPRAPGCPDECEPILLCAESPTDLSIPNSAHGLHRCGGALQSLDPSTYTMATLKFIQTGAGAFRLEVTPPGQSGDITNSILGPSLVGDVFGDGLSDGVLPIGCTVGGAMTCQLEGGPTTLPDGQAIAPRFLDPTKRGLFVSNHRGACATESSDARCTGSSGPPLAPDFLSYAADGMQREASWNYYPLGSKAGRSSGFGQVPFYSVPSRNAGAAYAGEGYIYFSSSMNAVESFAVSNGVGSERLQTFGYEEAMYNTQGRGFQGFRKVVQDVMPGQTAPIRTATVFHQKYPLTGMVERSETRLRLEVPGALQPIESVVNAYAVLDTANGRLHPYLQQSVKTTNDLQTRVPHTRVTSQVESIDAYGNVTQQRTTTEDGFRAGQAPEYATKVDLLTSIYAPHNDAPAGEWWVNKLSSTTRTQSIAWAAPPIPSGDQTRVLTTQYSDYAASRLPGLVVETGSGEANFRMNRLAYDQWGNVQSTSLFGAWIAESQSKENTFDHVASHGYFPNIQRNALAHATTTVFDPRFGIATNTTDPNGISRSTQLDSFGMLTASTDPTRTTQYSGKQWCTAGTCAGVLGALYRIEQRQNGAPTTITFFDQLDRAVGTASTGVFGQNGALAIQRTLREYYSNGLLRRESGPFFDGNPPPWTEFTSYDALGRVLSKSSPTAVANPTFPGAMLNRATTFTYSGLKTTVIATAPVVGASQGSLQMERTYTAGGQLLSTMDAAGGETHYRYDGAGNVTLIENPIQAQVRAAYNGLGQRTQTVDPDRGTWNFTYSAADELLLQTDGRGWRRHWVYDRLGRPSQEFEDRTQAATPQWIERHRWEYDTRKLGLLSRAQRSDDSYVLDVYYDHLARPSYEYVVIRERNHPTDPPSGSNPWWFFSEWERAYSYDGNYGWVKQIYQGPKRGSFLWEYEAAPYSQYWLRDRYGNVIEEGGVRDRPHGFGRKLIAQDAWGNSLVELLGNGRQGYDDYVPSTGQLASRCVGISPVVCDVLELDYTYDGWGNLVEQTQGGGAPSATEAFAYDPLHRMTQATRNGGAAGIVQYDYDAAGNFRKKSDYSQDLAAAYSYAGPRPHAVTAVALADGQTASFGYDGNGNQTQRTAGTTGRTVAYDIENRPELIATQGAYGGDRHTRFRYGPTGERFLQRELTPPPSVFDTKVTVYPFPGYEVDIKRQGSTGIRIDSGRQMLGSYGLWRVDSATPQGETIWRHGDRLGSPAAQSDRTATVKERRGFDAFGRPRSANWTSVAVPGAPPGYLGSLLSPRGFTGHEHLDTSQLIHMIGRAYDPLLGRFLSVDPIIQFPANSQSLNPYSYILNNPMAGTDPTGYEVCGAEKNPDCTHVDIRREKPVGSNIRSTTVITGNVANDSGISASFSYRFDQGGQILSGSISLNGSGNRLGSENRIASPDASDTGSTGGRANAGAAAGAATLAGSLEGARDWGQSEKVLRSLSLTRLLTGIGMLTASAELGVGSDRPSDELTLERRLDAAWSDSLSETDGLRSSGTRSVVIGESMDRVRSAAVSRGATINFGEYWKDNPTSSDLLAGLVFNAGWMVGAMINQMHIYDIGLDSRPRPRSPSYRMERQFIDLARYPSYERLPWEYSGGWSYQ